MFLAYLDEFRGTGSYTGRPDPQRYATPVFGRAGFLPPPRSQRPPGPPGAWRRIP